MSTYRTRCVLRIVRLTIAAAICGAVWLALDGTTPNRAAVPPDPFAGLERLSEGDLASRRGGFTIFGMHVSLGAEVVAMMNGHEVLRTVALIDGSGINVQHTVPSVANLPPEFAGLTFVGSNAPPGVATAPSVADATGNQIVISGVEGVVLSGQSGSLAVLQRITQNQLANIAVSTLAASEVSQIANFELTVRGMGDLQSNLRLNSLASHLFDSMRGAAQISGR